MFSAVASKKLDEVLGRMMSSIRDRFGHSADHEKVSHDFRAVSQCINTITTLGFVSRPRPKSSSTAVSKTRLANVHTVQETVQQLTECLTRIQRIHAPHPAAMGTSTQSAYKSTPAITKEERLILSLASQIVSQLYINLANNPKVFQKLRKPLEILLSLHPETRNNVEGGLQKLLIIAPSGLGMKVEDLSKVSSLLESSDIARDFLRRNFPQVLSSVAVTLSNEIRLYDMLDTSRALPCRVPAMDSCYQAAKVFLQMCQHGQDKLQPLLYMNARKDDLPSGNSCDEDLCHIIAGLITLLEDKRFSKDCGLIAGSCLAMMLNSAPSLKQAAEAITSILSRYSSVSNEGCHSSLKIGHTVIKTAPMATAAPSSIMFAQLAVTRGVLTCCAKAVLLEDVLSDHEQEPLHSVLFTLVCGLCRKVEGELKYHASEALMLYLQAMKSLLPNLLRDSTCPWSFRLDSTHTQVILQLVWQEWQSPVDKVAEMIRSALSTLLDLHHQESKALGLADSELVVSITSTLQNTAWHVKGRYHLLTSLVPHCSAVKLLMTWPSLPSDLLRCLGTNYLAAAATEVHNALVRRLREEVMREAGREAGPKRKQEGEEEYAERWGSIWKDVMLQGLCSQDGLVRYHTSKYWLPSAIKTFPGIFHLLIRSFIKASTRQPSNEQGDGFNVGSDVRRLHAYIVLLKYSRIMNLLESDWLEKYKEAISAGLWHMEDEIQADSLSLLCSSPKKSELPSNSEMLLLREALPHFLNSDSAAFRNQLRHNVNTFIIRLCDGGLVLLKRLKKSEVKVEKGFSSHNHYKNQKTDVTRVQQGNTKQPHSNVEDGISQIDNTSLVPLKEKLMQVVDCLEWLMEVCFGCLFPGACYQRKRAALDILAVLFEALVARDKQQTKTDSPEDLMTWALDHRKCNIFSERNASLLLECVLDGSNDLRSSAYHLLSTYFPPTLPSSSAYPYTSSSEVLCMALQLVSSPKVQDSEAGALLFKIIFYKHSVVKSLKQLDGESSSPPGSPLKSNGPSTEKGSVHFVESLLTSLTYQLKCCKKNLLQAAMVTPMHGLICAIRRCVTDQPAMLQRVLASDSSNWSSLMEKLLSTLQDITRFILLILSGEETSPVSLEDKESVSSNYSSETAQMAPSFGQMGKAIEKLITDLAAYRIDAEDSGEGGGMMVGLSGEHQVILACCWLNLKECSLLLGALAETVPLCNEDDPGVLTFDQLTLMANILVDILTRCRHKGAIEGCNQGFGKLCSRLLASPQPELQAMPKTLLDRVFGLVTREGTGSSFTKKSAGLPLLVESIISAEPRGRERPLLAYAMSSLMDIATQPLPADHNDNLDLPQSHALNIIMPLFRCSAVGTDILRYCSEAVMMAIGGFASPSWTIRNSSMRLFGTLIARIFGQKKVQDEHSQINALSATTFFSRYPELQEFLLKEVRKFGRKASEEAKDGDEAARRTKDRQVVAGGEGELGQIGSTADRADEISISTSSNQLEGDGGARKEKQEGNTQDGRLFLHPSLHPVLTLLSKLGPGVGNEDVQSLSEFLEPVKQLAGSAIYAVRELSTRALVPLVPHDQMLHQIVGIIDRLPEEVGSIRDFNLLHGNLLQVERLFEAALQHASIQQEDLISIQAKLEAKTWIAGSTNPCAVVRALFVSVAMAVISEYHRADPDSGATNLVLEMKKTVKEYLEGLPPFQIGVATLNRIMSTACLTLRSLTSNSLTSDLVTSVQALLNSEDSDVKLATLNYLLSSISDIHNSGDSATFQTLTEKLTHLISDTKQDTRCLEVALTLWVDLREKEEAGSSGDFDWLDLWQGLTGLVDGERGSGLSAAALPAVGQILQSSTEANKERKLVDQWCSWMVKYSDPSQSETMRLAVVKSVNIAAPTVWRQIAEEHTEDRIETSLDLLNVLLCCLQDELQDIRLAAASVVSLRLPRGATCPQYRHLHSNAAQQVLLDYICVRFSWSSRFMSSMLSMLQGSVTLSETIQQQHVSGTHLFEQVSANIYAEGVMQAKVLYQALVDTVERKQAEAEDCFSGWLAGWYQGATQLQTAREELSNTQQILKTCTALGGTFHGVSSHSKPYQAIYRQLLYVKFLCLVAKKADKDQMTCVMNELQLCVQGMLEMPSVHPCLKMELSSLLQMVVNQEEIDSPSLTAPNGQSCSDD